jgi:hypothetical protein
MTFYINEERDDTDKIDSLMSDVDSVVLASLKDDCFSVDDCDEIRQRMRNLFEQGVFWLDKGNTKRLIYDIKDFLGWICNFAETKRKEWWNEYEEGDE